MDSLDHKSAQTPCDAIRSSDQQDFFGIDLKCQDLQNKMRVIVYVTSAVHFIVLLSKVFCDSFTLHPSSHLMHRTLTRFIHKMYLLSESDIQRALDLRSCLEVTRQSLLSITHHTAVVPTRLGLPYPHNPNHPPPQSSSDSAQDWTLFKPAAHYGDTFVGGDDDNNNNNSPVTMGLKIVSIRAANPSHGLPLVPATILLLDAATGMVQAMLAGTYITVARTSAGPALAVKTFCPNVQHLVLFGAGSQAECHVQMMQLALERTIPKVTLVNRSIDRAEALRTKLLENSPEQEIQVLLLSDDDAVRVALSTADVVSATTNTATPLWKDGAILKKHCLITGIGSYTPDMQEIPESAVDRCHVIIDTPEAMEVGDLKHLPSSHPVTLAGEAFQNPSEIGTFMDCIFYKAVGTAIQDVLTARAVLERAKELGIGQEVEMG